MRLRRFQYHEVDRVDEVLALVQRYGEDLRILAGGTALLLMIRHGIVSPAHVVSLHRIPALRGIREDGDVIRIGALTSHAEIAGSEAVRRRCALLAAAVRRVATPAIRNMGTIGGNLCYAESASDVAPALLCLGARAVVEGPRGRRSVALTEGFYRGFYETALELGEVLVDVEVPAQVGAGRYIKFSPRSMEDRALVGLAVLADGDAAGGRCRELRLGLGGVNPTPVRLAKAEQLARGQVLSEALIREVASAAAAEVDPIADVQGSAEYRREMVRVWVRRALEELRERPAE